MGEGQGKATPTSAGNRFDAWMASNPWHPRLLPYAVYVLLLSVLVFPATDFEPALYPVVYGLQCGVVAWLLWRYRRLTPEVTLRFHWLALPVGVGVFVAWVGLGWAMAGEWSPRVTALWRGELAGPLAAAADDEPHAFQQMSPSVQALSLGMRLLGMSILVAVFEELFIRSLLLRGLHSGRQTLLGVAQMLEDVPLLGDRLMQTKLGDEAHAAQHVFTRQFEQTPLGRLSVFGVAASTVLFMLGHLPRDWPGTIVCGIAYCLLLAATARKGLGPVIWAHGITNALLWGYTLASGDWQFL